MEENRKYFLLYVLDLIDMLEQKFCQDSNLRVKLLYESDVLIKPDSTDLAHEILQSSAEFSHSS